MTEDHLGRASAVAFSVLAAIAIPAWQAIGHFGLSAAQFSAQGDQTLKAAPYAFAIWSVIYLGLVAFAIHQLRRAVRRSALMDKMAWPAAAGTFGCGLWIIASALNLQWLSVVVILASAASLIVGLLRAPTELSQSDKLLVIGPLTLLAGWLTVATGLNLVTVLTAQGWIGPTLTLTWASGAILVVIAIGALIGWRLMTAVYVAPVAWGLIGVAVAERGEPILPILAVAGALALALEAVLAARREPAPKFLQRGAGLRA